VKISLRNNHKETRIGSESEVQSPRHSLLLPISHWVNWQRAMRQHFQHGVSAWKRHMLEIDLMAGQAAAFAQYRVKESKPDGQAN